MKKWISIFCAIALMVAVAGCSGRGGESSAEASQDSSEESVSVDEGPPSFEQAQENNSQINEADINLIQFQDPRVGDTIAIVKTSEGDVTIRLFPDHAPMAVANFIGLAEDGYFNGKRFHLAARDLMIATGSLDNNGEGGTSIYTNEEGEVIPFADEFHPDLWHFRGAVSMWNDGADSNLSQFFIVQAPRSMNTEEDMERAGFPSKVVDRYLEHGGLPYLDGSHTIFGQVIDGLDVVDAINALERVMEIDLETGDEVEGDRLSYDVIIESVEITTY